MADSNVSEVRSMWVDGQFGYGFVICGNVAAIYASEQAAATARTRIVDALAVATRVKAS